MKQTLCMLLALFLLLAQAVPAFSADGTKPDTMLDSGNETFPEVSVLEPDSAQERALVEISSFISPDVAISFLSVLPLGSNIENALPQVVYGFYGKFLLIECPVIWDTSALTTPGRYTVPGTISTPEGYVLKKDAGLESTTITVAVYEDEPVVFFDTVESGSAYQNTILFTQNGDVTTLPLDEDIELISPDEDWLRVPLEWDLTALDTGKTGRYTVYGNPIMPPGAGLTRPDAQLAHDIYVMAKDAVDLGSYTVGSNLVFCSWLTSIDPDEAVLELSLDGEQWAPVSEMIPDFSYRLAEQHLELDTSILEVGKEYDFRILYQGKTDGTLHLTISNDNTPLPNWGGDRDGGDAEDDTVSPPFGQIPPPMPPSTIEPPKDTVTPPSVVPPPAVPPDVPPDSHESPNVRSPSSDEGSGLQPIVPPIIAYIPPEPNAPAENTSPAIAESIPTIAPAKKPQEPTTPTEIVTQNTLIISGARLAWMLQEGTDIIPFGWNGISLEIPADFLAGLAIGPQETLSLTLIKESSDAFTVALSVANTPLTDIAPTKVRFSCSTETAAPVLYLSEKRLGTVVTYENGCAVFFMEQLGSYRLGEEISITHTQSAAITPNSAVSAVTTTQRNTSPGDFLPVAGAAVLCMGGAFLLLRGKR